MDPINTTFGLFGAFLVWMAIDQLLIFQFDTSCEELVKDLYNWVFKKDQVSMTIDVNGKEIKVWMDNK